MKKLFCLLALAIIAVPFIKAQKSDGSLWKPQLKEFDFPNKSRVLRNVPFDFKARAFTNPLDQYALKIPRDSGFLALNRNRIEKAPQDNMPIVNPGNNFPMRNFKPDLDKQYYLRIYDPNRMR